MSFRWERVGSYRPLEVAEDWCARADITRNNRDIRNTADSVELVVRATAVDGRESEPRKNSFWWTTSENGPPDTFWQSLQWHAPTPIKSPSITNRAASHAQPPCRSVIVIRFSCREASM